MLILVCITLYMFKLKIYHRRVCVCVLPVTNIKSEQFILGYHLKEMGIMRWWHLSFSIRTKIIDLREMKYFGKSQGWCISFRHECHLLRPCLLRLGLMFEKSTLILQFFYQPTIWIMNWFYWKMLIPIQGHIYTTTLSSF